MRSRVTPHVPNARQVGPRYMTRSRRISRIAVGVRNEAQYSRSTRAWVLENMDVWLNGATQPWLIEQMRMRTRACARVTSATWRPGTWRGGGVSSD